MASITTLSRSAIDLAVARTAQREARGSGPGGSASNASAPAGARPGGGGDLLAFLDDRSRERHARADGPPDEVPVAESAIEGRTATPTDPAAGTAAAFRERFAAQAADPDAFHALMERTFGAGYDRAEAETIRQRALDGDFGWMPEVRTVDRSTLANRSGAAEGGVPLGAYAAETDTIYLSAQLLEGDPDRALEILTEEVGHALDARLNAADSAGDEGEIFARLSAGDALSREELAALRAEDDSGTILVDGREIEVEYGCDPVGDLVDGVRSVGRAIDDHVIQPTVGLVEDVVDIGKNTVETAIDIGKSVLGGGADAIRHVFQGDFSEAWSDIVDAGTETWEHTRGYVIETAAMSLHATASWLDGTLGLTETRGLNAEEREHLRSIYGDSLDYDKIRISRGGIRDGIGMDPHAVGYDIFLKDHSFEADGTLTENGLDLLAHEAAHAWQFENGGAGYLSDAILSYADDRDAAYDYLTPLRELTPWDDLTPDQQAEFAKLIGMAQDASPTGDVTIASLTAAIREDSNDSGFGPVTGPQLDYVLDIRQRLLAGNA